MAVTTITKTTNLIKIKTGSNLEKCYSINSASNDGIVSQFETYISSVSLWGVISFPSLGILFKFSSCTGNI